MVPNSFWVPKSSGIPALTPTCVSTVISHPAEVGSCHPYTPISVRMECSLVPVQVSCKAESGPKPVLIFFLSFFPLALIQEPEDEIIYFILLSGHKPLLREVKAGLLLAGWYSEWLIHLCLTFVWYLRQPARQPTGRKFITANILNQ